MRFVLRSKTVLVSADELAAACRDYRRIRLGQAEFYVHPDDGPFAGGSEYYVSPHGANWLVTSEKDLM